MNILVLVKKVPDANLPEQFISVSPDRSNVVLHSASQYSVNLYDLNAVELALTLKEKHGGTVTVMTAGDISAEQHLRRALSMGADRAVRVDVTSDILVDPHATADAIAAACRAAGPFSLIFAGRQASDTDAGLVPHAVAVALGVPSMSPVVAVGDATDQSIAVGKLSEDTIDYYAMPLPAVLCVSNEINKPRVPSLKGVMASKKVPVEVVQSQSAAQPPTATYAMKAAASKTAMPLIKDGSADEKAAALLSALGI